MNSPSKQPPLSRRMVLGAASLGLCAADGYRILTADDARILEAICEQIIPADADPGAREAGVVRYIDRQLSGPLRRFAKYYHRGLAVFRQSAPDFLERSFDEQTAFLQRMESGQMNGPEWRIQSAAAFFRMVIDHTMQGFYGSPRHGGNRGEASWKMLGIEKFMREAHHR